jgi:hypothetical protein
MKILIIIIANSILLAAGLLLLLFACILYSTGWPTLIALVFGLGLAIPILFGLMEPLCWVFVGIFLVIGYTIPIELFRKHVFSEGGLAMTMSGGSTIIVAGVVFLHTFVFKNQPTY